MFARRKREKIFGLDYGAPLDGNTKARIEVFVWAWSAKHKLPRQHLGPITEKFRAVLNALLWDFHNKRNGRCFPSYEAIADMAKCDRSVVAEAIKMLERTGVMTWVNRLKRDTKRLRGGSGQMTTVTKVKTTSNAYLFYDPKPKNPAEKLDKNFPTVTTLDSYSSSVTTKLERQVDSTDPLERALAGLKAAMEAARLALEQRAGIVPAIISMEKM